MAVGTRVVCVAFMAALIAALQMAAQRGCAAAFDGLQHTLLSHRQRLAMRLAKRLAMSAHNVSDFQCKPHENAGLLFGIVDGIRE
jgi:hypothetical protein